jgi:hypothetical protein
MFYTNKISNYKQSMQKKYFILEIWYKKTNHYQFSKINNQWKNI